MATPNRSGSTPLVSRPDEGIQITEELPSGFPHGGPRIADGMTFSGCSLAVRIDERARHLSALLMALAERDSSGEIAWLGMPDGPREDVLEAVALMARELHEARAIESGEATLPGFLGRRDSERGSLHG